MKINVDIVNDVNYKHAKCHYEIHCIVGYWVTLKKLHLKIYILKST
jgi:hypothetical protein